MPDPRSSAGASPTASPSFRRDALPLLAGYWSFGQFWGVWVILVFEFQQDHGISEARIGLDYTLLSLVAVAVMLTVAPRMQPLALSTSVPVSLATLAVASIALAYLPDAAILVAFLLAGVGNALIDVYLNVAAQRVEARARRPVLQWLHACYALGGATGAAIAGAIRTAGIDYRLGLAYVAVALLATTVWTARTASREPGPEAGERTWSVAALARAPGLWIPAVIVLFAFVVEGSMDVWSGLYLRGQLGASAGMAATAFVGFASAVFVGRLVASRVLFGRGRRATIILAGTGAAASGLMVTISSQHVVVGVGFVLLGFTISAASPAAFGLVEEVDPDGDRASGIAAVATVGYTGFIWSPALLGWIADAVSLRAAMGVIVIATFGIVAGGLLAPRDAPL